MAWISIPVRKVKQKSENLMVLKVFRNKNSHEYKGDYKAFLEHSGFGPNFSFAYE